jgi:hypothetical protein
MAPRFVVLAYVDVPHRGHDVGVAHQLLRVATAGHSPLRRARSRLRADRSRGVASVARVERDVRAAVGRGRSMPEDGERLDLRERASRRRAPEVGGRDPPRPAPARRPDRARRGGHRPRHCGRRVQGARLGHRGRRGPVSSEATFDHAAELLALQTAMRGEMGGSAMPRRYGGSLRGFLGEDDRGEDPTFATSSMRSPPPWNLDPQTLHRWEPIGSQSPTDLSREPMRDATRHQVTTATSDIPCSGIL